MRLAVISDTHAQVLFTQAACHLIGSLGAEVVIHCGDIGSVEIVPLFAAWPTHFVFGNVDSEPELRRAIQAAGQTCHERFGELELAGRKVAFLHGDDFRLLDETIRNGEYDLVCHGHTHLIRQERIGRTLVLNPGAIYRANPHSFAIVEMPAVDVTVIEV